MPSYDFACDTCHRVEEVTRSMKDTSTIYCEDCNSAMRQLISNSSFILKGDGWVGKELRQEADTNYIRSVSKRARDLKTSGKVPMEERLTFKDTERLNPE